MLALIWTLGAGVAWGAEGAALGAYVSVPDTITGSLGTLTVERGLFFAPENRARPGRTIAIQFLRFKAETAAVAPESQRRAPVFLLAGGPGAEYDFAQPWIFRKVQRLRRTRDVIYVSQRGNPSAAGLVPQLWLPGIAAALDEPGSVASAKARDRAALSQVLTTWSARGLDLSGYDILNIVDDVHELRAALGYEKIVLCGCSFGSQWSFAYIKRWPETVDRALLSGVEPLDFAYDSPRGLWASMRRLAQSAESDPMLAPRIPRGGLMKVVQTLVKQLEAKPVRVSIVDPTNGRTVELVLGVEDLRAVLADVYSFDGATKRERLTRWPRFLIELSTGDYRYLAAKTWERRTRPEREVLILPLIDNSLGISAVRDSRLVAEPEARWLGDINAYYRNTADLVPTPDVGDGFRSDWKIAAPVLLVNGDLDWSTPIENAEHARTLLGSGHLLKVKGGTHCTESDELAEVFERVHAFIDADFDTVSPRDFFATLPDEIAYPVLRFDAPGGSSLYERWLASRRAE